MARTDWTSRKEWLDQQTTEELEGLFRLALNQVEPTLSFAAEVDAVLMQRKWEEHRLRRLQRDLFAGQQTPAPAPVLR